MITKKNKNIYAILQILFILGHILAVLAVFVFLFNEPQSILRVFDKKYFIIGLLLISGFLVIPKWIYIHIKEVNKTGETNTLRSYRLVFIISALIFILFTFFLSCSGNLEKIESRLSEAGYILLSTGKMKI